MRYILISGAVAFFIIGIHQTMTVGLAGGYFFFMVVAGLILWLRLRIVNEEQKKGKP